ncbi:copper ion binding protein [Thalictrum thalictroides]|uniref:Copper ion binding protein n=1 Tax=Thalictrum thalictroides TaxID=46969 RepID=A0A7J6V2S1_THATH|nr:copper ion binding protein [Thalictrum thalictroides]
MASAAASRYMTRRLSSSGKVLSEEEKAAENIFIKKTEQEKLEKLARKEPKPEETATSSGGSTTDAKPSDAASSTSGASTDNGRNYGFIHGVVVGVALGWYLKSRSKKSEVSN